MLDWISCRDTEHYDTTGIIQYLIVEGFNDTPFVFISTDPAPDWPSQLPQNHNPLVGYPPVIHQFTQPMESMSPQPLLLAAHPLVCVLVLNLASWHRTDAL